MTMMWSITVYLPEIIIAYIIFPKFILNMESFAIFVEYRMRLGNSNPGKTKFSRLAAALAFHNVRTLFMMH